MDYQHLISEITPAVVSLTATILTYIAVMIGGYIKRKTGLEIEAFSRDALHRALESGVELAVAKARGDALAVGAAKADLVAMVVTYVRMSVPDAIKTLGPSEDLLKDLALSKLERRISAPSVLATGVSDDIRADVLSKIGRML